MSKREQSVQATQEALQRSRQERQSGAAPTKPTGPAGLLSDVLQKEQIGLRQQLEAMEQKFPPGSLSVQKLDPKKVRWSRFYNRAPEAFLPSNLAFKELLTKLEAAGGNTVPVLVFKLPVPEEGIEYELSYGHRRLEGTKQLGLEVLAIVLESMSREEQAKMQILENEGREDISVIEKAKQFSSQMASGVWGTVEVFANAVGYTRPHAQNLKAIGEHIPDTLALAHPNVSSINYRQAMGLVRLAKDDPATLKKRIELVRVKRDQVSAAQATSLLLTGALNKVVPSAEHPNAQLVKKRDSFKLAFSANGSLEKQEALLKGIEDLCERLEIPLAAGT